MFYILEQHWVSDTSYRKYPIGNQPLSSAFVRIDGARKDNIERLENSRIPRVECIYSPLDPVAQVQKQTPRWIAVDCGEASSIQWIVPLLEYTQSKNIPLIAWSSNPLSPIRASFKERNTNIFTWPLSRLNCDSSNKNIGSPEVLKAFTQAPNITKVTPCLINSSTRDTFSEYFQNTQKL